MLTKHYLDRIASRMRYNATFK